MVRWARIIYLISAWLFIMLVLIQVFLAGMVVVAGQINWTAHKTLGHWVGVPILIMLITAYLGQLPVAMKRLTWLVFGTFIVQAEIVIFLRSSMPIVSALHPVLALVHFAFAVILAYQALNYVKNPAGANVTVPRSAELSGD